MTLNRLRSLVFSVAALLPVVALAGCVHGPYPWHEGTTVEPEEVAGVPNLTSFGDEVYFAAQPEPEAFQALADRGVKTVINLRTDEEMAQLPFDESEVVREAGMSYFQVPIGREEPEAATIEIFNNLVDDPDNHPIFVHCASSNRVGYLWSMLRGSRHDLPEDQAIEEGRAAGMRSPELERRARSYIQGSAAAPEE